MSDKEKQRIIVLWMRCEHFTALNNEKKIEREKNDYMKKQNKHKRVAY